MASPDAVDHDSRRQRLVRPDQPLSKLQPAALPNVERFLSFACQDEWKSPRHFITLGEMIAAEVNADKALGQKVGIQHTPTIYIVSSRNRGRPVVEVTDSTQLFQMIEAVQAE